MRSPTSDLFKVEDILDAGRGVVASQRIPDGILVLDSQAPAAHVIFRQYRREVCAHCFHYDLGRTLPVRDNDTGKVFCSSQCQATWRENHGELALEAWRALHAFLQTKSKAIVDIYSIAPLTPKPGVEQIENKWRLVNEPAHLGPNASLQSKDELAMKGRRKMKQSSLPSKIYPDILGFLTTGILYHYSHPDAWQGVLSLAMDETPYKSTEDLEAHCNSFLQLRQILPHALQSSCSTAVCRILADAGSHNAFGIRSGSEDGEEYMGYGLYTAASYFNHSCSPNITKRRVGSSWEFRTASDVEPGEECCITYLGGDEKDLTVAERRARLKEVWGFVCMCVRCNAEG